MVRRRPIYLLGGCRYLVWHGGPEAAAGKPFEGRITTTGMAGPDTPYPALLAVAAALAAVAAAAPASADHLTGEPVLPQSRFGAPGGFDTLEWAGSIAIHEISNRTYAVVSSMEGIQIMDVTYPKSPSPTSAIFGEYAMLGSGRLINVETAQISGRTYAVAAIGEGIRIIDITAPAAPAHAASILNGRGGFGNVTGAGSIAGMAVAEISGGHYLLAAAPAEGAVLVIDVTDPTAPRPASRAEDGRDGFEALEGAIDVEVAVISGGTYAVVAGWGGIQIIDMSDPAAPRPASAVPAGRDGFGALGWALDVQIAQISGRTYAMVASHQNGSVQVVDVTDPTAPRPAAGIFDGRDGFESLEGAADIETVAASGRTYALVASLMDGLQVVDVTDPTAPRPAAAVQGGRGEPALGGLSDIEIFTVSGRMYAAGSSPDRSSVEIIDVTDPTAPSRTSAVFDDSMAHGVFEDALSLDVATISGRPYAMAFTWRGDALHLVDVSDPAAPVPASSIFGEYRGALHDRPDVDAVSISNRTYALASIWNGVRIADITDPSAPAQVASVSDGRGGFEALGGACGLDAAKVSGRAYAVVAAEDDGAVQVMDITDPADPRPAASAFDGRDGFEALSGACSVEMAEVSGRAYAVVAGWEGIQIIDMSDPAAPRPASAVPAGRHGLAPYGPADIEVATVSGRTYVLAAGHGGVSEIWPHAGAVQIVEITDPSAPSLVASLASGQDGFGAIGRPSDVEVVASPGGTYALVSSTYPGGSIQVIDITDPSRPRLAASAFDDRKGFGSLGGAADIEVVASPAGTYAMVLGFGEDYPVQVVDITDPSRPRPVAGIAPDDPRMLDAYAGANGVAIVGVSGRTYAVASGTYDDAVQVVDITDPSRPRPVSDTFFRGGSHDGGAREMEVVTASESGRAYVLMSRADVIHVLDITDPADPSRDDYIVYRARGMEVAEVSGSTYLVAAGGWPEHNVLMIGMTDPAGPTWVAEMVDGRGGFEALAMASGVAVAEVSGRLYAVVASPLDDAVQIIDMTHPADPLPTAAVFDGEAGFEALAMASGVAVAEVSGRTYAVVAGWEGIQIIDMSSPSAPRPAAALLDGRDGIDLPSGHADVEVAGVGGRTFALVTGTVDGIVRAVDITNPADPVPVPVAEVRGLFKAHPGSAAIAEILGRTYAVVAGDGGVRAVDITGTAPSWSKP